jgi:hypothetical protein
MINVNYCPQCGKRSRLDYNQQNQYYICYECNVFLILLMKEIG